VSDFSVELTNLHPLFTLVGEAANASFLSLFSAIQVAWYVLITARKTLASSEPTPMNTENGQPRATNL
jgi:hypothetical protein